MIRKYRILLTGVAMTTVKGYITLLTEQKTSKTSQKPLVAPQSITVNTTRTYTCLHT